VDFIFSNMNTLCFSRKNKRRYLCHY